MMHDVRRTMLRAMVAAPTCSTFGGTRHVRRSSVTTLSLGVVPDPSKAGACRRDPSRPGRQLHPRRSMPRRIRDWSVRARRADAADALGAGRPRNARCRGERDPIRRRGGDPAANRRLSGAGGASAAGVSAGFPRAA
jgi:hypothetical protein